jgi:tetratricopeptide (TPR) repeat protein
VLLGLGGIWCLLLAASSLQRTRQWKDDLTLFRTTVERAPRSVKARTDFSVALAKSGHLEDAVREAKEALRLLPEYPPAADAYGSALTQTGRSREAIPWLRQAGRAVQENGDTFLRLGNAYLEIGQGAAADSAFQVAERRLGDSDCRLWIGRASALAQLGRWSESKGYWQRAARNAPEDRSILRNLAYTLWKSGDPDSAEIVYRAVLFRAADETASLNDLAWFLAASGRDPAEGEALARRAFRSHPDGTIGDTLLEALVAARGCGAARVWLDSLEVGGTSMGPDVIPQLRESLRRRCAK